MQTFAVVAVRLIGMWILANGLPGVIWLRANLANPSVISEQWGEMWIAQVGMIVAPLVTGLVLLVFSRPIAAFVVHGVAEDAAAPDAPTVRGFTQVGLFLMGTLITIRSAPFALASLFSGAAPNMSLDLWFQLAIGIVLMVSVAPFGKILDRLRQ